MTRTWLALLFLPACTFDAGSGFTTLIPGTLTLVLDPELSTELGHEITIEALELGTAPLELQELQGGTTTFDPADPPDGYSLCHNGHCHAEDGSLPTYAEIEAALAGGSAQWSTVARVRVGEIDALGEPVELGEVLPSPELPAADIGHLLLPVDHLVVHGVLTSTEPPVPLTIDLPAEVQVPGSLALPVDRSTEPAVRLDIEWTLPDSLLDGVDWAALAIEGEIVVDEAGSATAMDIADNLLDGVLVGHAE